MSRIVRQSKFRHVFGTAFKLEHTYQDLKVYASAWDSDCIKANRQFFAIAWQAGGGGSLAVIRHQDTGKRTGAEVPVLTGHKAQILDWDFNPFNDYIIASASEDCTVKIWGIPEGGLTQSTSSPLVSIDAHNRKVGLVNFHPSASNVLLTAGLDFKVKLWDIENTSAPKNSVDFKEYVMSVSWNQDGSQFAAACKDKFLRLVDPRANSIVAEGASHQGTKGSRVTWLKNKNKLFTVGFSKLSERQYMVWDPRDISKPLITQDVDVAAGTLMPFYDEDTNMLYIAGKGDGNVRYYEVIDDEPFLYPLSEFKTNSPQRGFTFLPKLAVDTSLCEVSRGYKLENNSVTPIMFQVPRKAETFQEDLYPDTPGPEPALTGADWFGGQTAGQKLVSMRPGSFTQSSAPKLSDFKPKVEYKEETKLPPKSVDPKTLMAQNDEFRAKIAELENENASLRKKIQELTNQ